jgi:hypothetical protein
VSIGKLLQSSVTNKQRRSLFTVRKEICFERLIAFLNINFTPLTDQFGDRQTDRHETYKHHIDLKDRVVRTTGRNYQATAASS